ncbi:hypothetical protein FGX01_00580, partial [Xylella fastidiosa subsp. multiplex]|nr:hypothetical protein [Xylella fastidiosa subsp. multiplex]
LVGAGRTLAMWLAGPLVKALQVAALALRAAFLSNPIGLVIASVALLAYAIYTHFDKIKHAVRVHHCQAVPTACLILS